MILFKFFIEPGVLFFKDAGAVEFIGGEAQFLHKIPLQMSTEDIDVETWWPEAIKSFDPPRLAMPYPYGGHVALRLGNVTVDQKILQKHGHWPPPMDMEVDVASTTTNEADAEHLFEAAVHLAGIRQSGVKYGLFNNDDQDLLSEIVDYDGNTVPRPKAFGAISFETPVRVADDDQGRPTYDMAGIQGAPAIKINFIEGDDAITTITAPGHTFAAGEEASISGAYSLDGSHTVTWASGDQFRIMAGYTAPMSGELVFDGRFDTSLTDGFWNSEGGWEITSSGARYTGAPENARLSQTGEIHIGALYQVQVDYTPGTTGGFSVLIGGKWMVSINEGMGAMQNPDRRGGGQNNLISLEAWGGWDGTIESLSIKEIDSAPPGAQCWRTGDPTILVFDDAAAIPGNVVINVDTFSLTATPVGKVTISSPQKTTLIDEAASVASRQGWDIDTSLAFLPSPEVVKWVDNDQSLLSFFSDMEAFFHHMSHEKDGVLILMEMKNEARSWTTNSDEYFPSEWIVPAPISVLKTSVTIKSPSPNGAINETVKPLSSKGDYVFGRPMSIEAFHDDPAVVQAALDECVRILQLPTRILKVPLNNGLPSPGEKITETDKSLGVGCELTGVVRSRDLKFYLAGEIPKVEIIGEGEFS